jgi:hypothetical protein
LPLYAFMIIINLLLLTGIYRSVTQLGRQSLFPRFADGCVNIYGRLAQMRAKSGGAT